MALGRRRRVHRRSVRDRRRPAAADAGFPLRPLEGPARGHRRLPARARGTADVQLALVGSMAHDDPEGWDFYNQTIAHAAGDPDIYILSNLNNVGSVEVNAFQVSSAAVIQKSIREGFGLRGLGGALEGPADRGRTGGRHRRDRGGRTGSSSTRRRSVPARASRTCADPGGPGGWRSPARSTSGRTS